MSFIVEFDRRRPPALTGEIDLHDFIAFAVDEHVRIAVFHRAHAVPLVHGDQRGLDDVASGTEARFGLAVVGGEGGEFG